MDLLTATRIRDLARRFGVTPSRALGQNFVIDANTIRRVVRLADIRPGEKVIEVGAGFGSLTLGLAEAAEKVIAVEADLRLVAALKEVMEGAANVEVVHADALALDFEAATGGEPHRFVGNLPYNIATPLIATVLEDSPSITGLIVMVQREVGERLTAGPGSRTYGAISVRVAYHCEAAVLGRVPPSVFWPPPNVESVLVGLTRRPPPVPVDSLTLMHAVRAAFAQRRKTLRNSIASVLEIPGDEATERIKAADLNPASRAEDLSLEEFARLAQFLRDTMLSR